MSRTTPAHIQELVLQQTLRLYYPEHEPRTCDIHYKLFRQAKARMRHLDLPCWRCGVRYKDLNVRAGLPATERNPLAAFQLEAHHSEIEFALQNAIDVARWWDSSARDDSGFMVESFSRVDGWLEKHPEFTAYTHDELFKVYVESESNLQQLCDRCHRSRDQGIHWIPYPDWRPLAVWRRDLPAHVQPVAA